jgi:hypothetical protein
MPYSCGQIGPGGGTVFIAVPKAFSLSNGYTTAACGTNSCHYMEAQLALLPAMPWCVGAGQSTKLSPGTGAAIGTGYSNTMTMATFSNYCSSGAANVAKASTSGGYTDWYVPSVDEADALKNILVNQFTGGGVSCWTSSQTSKNQASYIAVKDGHSSGKADTAGRIGVCLVRTF